MHYFYQEGDNKFGPFTLEELQHKSLHPDTLVWKEGSNHFVEASKLPELTSGFTQPKRAMPGTLDAHSPDRAADKRKTNKTIFITILCVGGAVALVLYVLLFNNFSETELVQLSYFWLPFIVYGLVGLLANSEKAKRPHMVALISTAGALLLLTLFFGSLWSTL